MPATETADRHFWERTALGWHLVFGAVLVMAALLMLAADARAGTTIAAVAGLAAWAACYAALAAPIIAGPHYAANRARLYAYVAIGLFWTVLSLEQSGNVALFILIPQLYALLETLREAIVTVGVLLAGFVTILVLRFAESVGDSVSIIGITAVSFVFSIVLAAWINGIIAQSRQRAELIAALRTARQELNEVSHDRGVLAERERMSREIHDTLAQGFTSIVMLLEVADAAVGSDDERARRHLGLAQRTARENLAEARSLVGMLAPAPLAEASLVQAVRRLVVQCAEEVGMSTDMQVAGPARPLPAASEVVVLRAAQEMLSNVRRHAGATAVSVSLTYTERGATLQVCDDGRGFDPVLAAGFGLHGMRRRVGAVGGSMDVRSAPGRGTTIRVCVP